MSVGPIKPLVGMVTGTPGFQDPKAQGGFADTLKQAVNEVEQMHQTAENSVQDLATGSRKTLHQTMIDVEKADIAFRMLMGVRGKMIGAYQEIWRMNF
ncbi:flagellar hook-basal body complex subunit FliE [Desulfarculus baarsii DSM 2075]|uniref:Flagellar hook-basal body complex protein FliE n=1 Tax=Desulfarculus baarsii (strain ATCC 33931 / DSM 2075 / LMG 7858 / VKM B-1802 / 2st14) TaxID=644282 RepID=E1QFE5_DESB2|nr:flagellar hook-basal body complex protein FliE [Desulfarculus baarsii]ADK84281.1 flagellar hook-basal body complex subunit FliE [Desulfarculus baarsii DSM 2075]